ncbi:hypothetical protein OAR97_06525 [Arcobacteraceae bacterium]|nr:hypothetical protein [Arcobacteraceae bacterium]
MEIISHSKCRKCKEILLEGELKQNDNGIGLICIDTKACENRIIKNKQEKRSKI